MKSPFKARPKSYLSRAERVSAIEKALQEGSYKIDTTNIANILIIQLLHHATRLPGPSLKRQCTLN
jgi:anti-sigma28 factor (negative regulator of flagellin synthesis)